jgi:hypothetical protein
MPFSFRRFAKSPRVGALALAAAVAMGSAMALQEPDPAPPNGPIEQRFRANGPWAAEYQANIGCCDSAGFKFTAWFPTVLGQGGFRHPIITWGNGTGAPPEAYDFLLRHLASWGFVVIASRQPNAGSGAELRDAIAYLRAENARSGSRFYQKLALDKVGAMGHSQGAVGAVNAMRDGAGTVRTAVALAIPAQQFCPQMGHCADTGELTSGAMLFVNGTLDKTISPSTQADGVQGLQSNQAYYRATPKALPKAWGALTGVAHSDLMGQPDCPKGVDPDCHSGVQGFLGYPTAWLMDQLQGDPQAHSAFVDGSGEFFLNAGQWRHQVGNIQR